MPTPASRHQLRYYEDISKAWPIPMTEMIIRIAFSDISLEGPKALTREVIVPTNSTWVGEITLRKETYTVR